MNEIINFGEKKRVKIIMLKGEKGDKGEDGSSGDYSALTNKPQINDVELSGNKTASDLGIVSETEFEQFENATNTSITKVQDSLATIETTSTSAHGYSDGAYLVYNGYLYKALSDISVGDTLDDTEATGNIGRVRIGGELYALKDELNNKQDILTNPLTQSDVINNLASTSIVNPLSANQGKELNDKIESVKSDIFSIASYTYDALTVSASSDSGVVYPVSNTIDSGYTPIAITELYIGQCALRFCNAPTGSMAFRNIATSAATITPRMRVLCVKTEMVKR